MKIESGAWVIVSTCPRTFGVLTLYIPRARPENLVVLVDNASTLRPSALQKYIWHRGHMCRYLPR